MTDNVAILEGYTDAIVASSWSCELYLLVKPDTDFDSSFKAWDTIEQEFILVNGWNFTFEEDEMSDSEMEWTS